MQIVFLGTSGSWPTPKRNVSAVAVKRGPEIVLFDCGEGTQRQFMQSRLSFMQVSRVFLSHSEAERECGRGEARPGDRPVRLRRRHSAAVHAEPT